MLLKSSIFFTGPTAKPVVPYLSSSDSIKTF